MNWQIIVGAIFLIGSIGCLADGFVNFMLALLIGGGLMYWGLRKKGYFKKKVTHQYEVEGCVLAYSYDDVKFYPPAELVSKINKVKFQKGAEIQLVQEPENPVDHAAVALYLGNQKIGYLLRNKLQDMANDYIGHGWPVKASLVSLKKVKGDYQGFIALAFFRPGE